MRSLIAVSLAVLTGCASVTFKRGASPDAMAAAERDCRAASSDETSYAECLRARGWFVNEAGAVADDAPARASVTEPRPLGEETGAAAKDEKKESPTAAGAAPAGVEAPVAGARPAPPEQIDPMTRVAVGSWWKLGGSAADLDGAIDACVGKLGDEHRPNAAATIVTAGLRACLRTAGWHPIGKSAP